MLALTNFSTFLKKVFERGDMLRKRGFDLPFKDLRSVDLKRYRVRHDLSMLDSNTVVRLKDNRVDIAKRLIQ